MTIALSRRTILAGLLGTSAAMTLGSKLMAQSPSFFRIVSGGTGGTYYPIAGLIGNAISNPPGSRSCEDGGSCGVPGLVAIAQSSNGGAANVTAVGSGQAEGGFAPADLLEWANKATGPYEGQTPVETIRVIANLFAEHLHLVTLPGSNIASYADLAGKRVGIGSAGSGTQVAVLEILAKLGMTRDDFSAAELNISQSTERLQDGALDAFFYIAGVPAGGIAQLAATAGMKLVGMSPDEQAAALEVVPFYQAAEIAAGAYDGVETPVTTLAVGTQFVVHAGLDEDLAYGITKALWSDQTRKLLDAGHAKGREIVLENALNGITLPLHPGAEKFYREAGML